VHTQVHHPAEDKQQKQVMEALRDLCMGMADRAPSDEENYADTPKPHTPLTGEKLSLAEQEVWQMCKIALGMRR
jgi:hypothetical protein